MSEIAEARVVKFCMQVGWPSVLWRYWLGARKGIRPLETPWWGTGVVLSGLWSKVQMICILSSWCHYHRIISYSSKIRKFIFLVPAYPGCPGKKAVKWM